MTPPADVITPCILVVDDEKQIHSSLRLRLGESYRLTCVFRPSEALELVSRQRFDLCIVDIHMPGMDGLSFIAAARERDAELGYVVLSGDDSDENLRRAIPLHVYDFVSKPLTDRETFDHRLPEWIDRTRRRRQEAMLAGKNQTFVRDLELARIERDVEFTASASAREALLQTAGLLTTTHALLFNAQHILENLPRTDPRIGTALRSLQEARKQAESAALVAEGYFGSAYADRESSPAVIDTCVQHAIGISQRLAHAEAKRLKIDSLALGREAAVTGLTGIEFLLMLVPSLIQALHLAAPGTTLKLRCQELSRLDRMTEEADFRAFLWVNRRNALASKPGILLSLRAQAPALTEETATAWLRGEPSELQVTSRGILHGVQKAKGLIGLAVSPSGQTFEMVVGLPL